MVANDDAMLPAPGSYPLLSLRHPTRPNRLWAFPIVGILVKSLILVPVVIWLAVLSTVAWLAVLINSFVVLFNGHYWVAAYGLAVGLLRLETKIFFYTAGLTDHYPGFGLTMAPHGDFSLDIPMPGSPSRGFAIPMLGGIARGVLLIPIEIWAGIVAYSAYLAVMVASFPVLFAGCYPISFLELARDAQRLYLGYSCYALGLSDSYPSFSISMTNPVVKGLHHFGYSVVRRE